MELTFTHRRWFTKTQLLFVFVFLFVFWDGVSLCSSRHPTTPFIDQIGLKLTEIGLSLLPECWDQGIHHHQGAKITFIYPFSHSLCGLVELRTILGSWFIIGQICFLGDGSSQDLDGDQQRKWTAAQKDSGWHTKGNQSWTYSLAVCTGSWPQATFWAINMFQGQKFQGVVVWTNGKIYNVKILSSLSLVRMGLLSLGGC